jgi:two-component system osmolarity sensor histidine kinase EnvZ
MSFKLKKILPQTLFGRSLLIILTPVLLLQFIVTFIFYDRHWNRMTDRLAFALVGEMAIIIEAVENAPSAESVVNDIGDNVHANLDIILSYEPGLKRLPQQELDGLRPEIVARQLRRVLANRLEKPYTVSVGEDERIIEISFLVRDGVLTFTVPERRLFSSSSYIFVLWMIGISLILFAISIVFMRNQIRPIRRLAVAAEWFGRGKDVTNFKPAGSREVRQAAKAFITMRDRIKRQISQRTEMLAGVSHDLRTPLTRLKLELELLEDSDEATAMRKDIDDMERMIEGYLDFARGDAQEEPELIEVQLFLEKLQKDAKRQNIAVEVENLTKYPVSAWLRINALTRCFMNLINNANHYADNIRISFEADMTEQQAIILIDDDGPGIPAEKRDDVFKPFYRLESSRNQRTGGVGLGLSIAQDVITGHGGSIALDESPLGGLRVVIQLPL